MYIADILCHFKGNKENVEHNAEVWNHNTWKEIWLSMFSYVSQIFLEIKCCESEN
jgi:hypothetical protein